MTREAILAEVSAERDRQQQYYGPAHDDAHPDAVWLALLMRHAGLAILDGGVSEADRFERQMVRVAAVAVAALSSAARRREAGEILARDAERKRWQLTADSLGGPILILNRRQSHVYGTEDCITHAVLEAEADSWQRANYVMRVEPAK